MKDTRNFDRAPLKDIRVKDNLIGVRTPQVLMSRESGDYLKGDILDANATMLAIKQASGDVDLSGYLPLTGGTISLKDKWSKVDLSYAGVYLYQQNVGKAYSRMRIAGSTFDICRCETTDESKINYNNPDYKISVNSSKATMYGNDATNSRNNGWKICTRDQKISDVLSESTALKQLDTPSLYLASTDSSSVGLAAAITTYGAIFWNNKENYIAILSKKLNGEGFASGLYSYFSGIEIKSSNYNMGMPVFSGIKIILPKNDTDAQYVKPGIYVENLNTSGNYVFAADGSLKSIGYDIARLSDLETLQQTVADLKSRLEALEAKA